MLQRYSASHFKDAISCPNEETSSKIAPTLGKR